MTGYKTTASTAPVVGDLAAATTSLVDAADGPLLKIDRNNRRLCDRPGRRSDECTRHRIHRQHFDRRCACHERSSSRRSVLQRCYTPYNLAINIGPAASTSLSRNWFIGPLVDGTLDVVHGTSDPTDHGGPAQLHGALPSVLDELHLRGAIDSLGL